MPSSTTRSGTIRNSDNIVAKRGALFMIDLKHAVQEMVDQVVHIKTDSIKMADPTPEINEFISTSATEVRLRVRARGDIYDKFCLVNDARRTSLRYGWADKEKLIGTWDATGAQFQHPYVYKTLFANEESPWMTCARPSR